VLTDEEENRSHPTVKLIEKLLAHQPVDQPIDLSKHINSYGQTVLHLAASYNNDELIKLILSYPGCKSLLNSSTYEELQTPLHYAARCGSNKAVKCLIEDFNANKEEKDRNNRTPLYLAAEYGQKYTIRRLIELECNMNVINKSGQKALYWMVAKCPDCVKKKFLKIFLY
jgi:ankyrin repeat protein